MKEKRGILQKPILLVCDDFSMGRRRAGIFARNGYFIHRTKSVSAARKKFESSLYDFLVIDVHSRAESEQARSFCRYLVEQFPKRLFSSLLSQDRAFGVVSKKSTEGSIRKVDLCLGRP